MTAGIQSGDLTELAQLINFRIGAWQDFGYENPPSADCVPIPPLGRRSTEARAAAQEALRDIDRLAARLAKVRRQLEAEIREDENIRRAALEPPPESRS